MAEDRSIIAHEIDCNSEYFIALVARSRTFDIQKSDRDFKKGQYIRLWEVINEVRTGWYLEGSISYVLKSNEFLTKEHVVFSIAICFFHKDGSEGLGRTKFDPYQTFYAERELQQGRAAAKNKSGKVSKVK